MCGMSHNPGTIGSALAAQRQAEAIAALDRAGRSSRQAAVAPEVAEAIVVVDRRTTIPAVPRRAATGSEAGT